MKWWLTVALYFIGSYWRRLLLFGGVAALMAVGVMVLVMFVGKDSDRKVEASQSTPESQAEAPVVEKVRPSEAAVVSTKAPISVVEPKVAPVVSRVEPTKAPANTPIPAPTAAPTPEPKAAAEPTPNPIPILAEPSRIEVPVILSQAHNVGSLEFILVYEPEMLKLVEVKKGALAGESLLDSASRSPGRIWTALINPQGITGDGTAAVFTFDLLDSDATESKLEIQGVYAHEATTLLDLLAEPSHGQFVSEGLSITSPALNFIN